MTQLKAPFPYMGGKSRVAETVWERFGDVQHYIEPFAGSLAVLLGRPHDDFSKETVNDKDGFIANFWRALKNDPEQLAERANYPKTENDMHARRKWLASQRDTLTQKLENDPHFYDTKIAGWWVWGMALWPWGGWPDVEKRSIMDLTSHGMGILTKSRRDNINDVFDTLAERLKHVRVCSGDWSRVVTPSKIADDPCAVFLDPPYTDKAERDNEIYAVDSEDVGYDVLQWCIENGPKENMRIALCGYSGEYELPDNWIEIAWEASGGPRGDGISSENRLKERIWFSPHCYDPTDIENLFIGQFLEKDA